MHDRLADYYDISERAYVVPLTELGDLKLGDVPPHSSLYVKDLPLVNSVDKLSVHVTNDGDHGDDEFLSIWGYVGIAEGADFDRRMSRIRRAYTPLIERGLLPDPLVIPNRKGLTSGGAGFGIGCAGQTELLICEAIEPLLLLFKKLAAPAGKVFICHASENKSVAHELALFMEARGVEVWLDKWEIKVGDSIVEKINEGLGSASHLTILLSHAAVTKPWVTKELSAALMRQLSDRLIRVLPVRLDDCSIPPILADLRYADCRSNASFGFQEVLEAVMGAESLE